MIDLSRAKRKKNFLHEKEEEIIFQVLSSMAISCDIKEGECNIKFSPFECFHKFELQKNIADYLNSFLDVCEQRILYFCAFSTLSNDIIQAMRTGKANSKSLHPKIRIIKKADMVSTKIEKECEFKISFIDVIIVETSFSELKKAIALCKKRNIRIARVVLLFGNLSDQVYLEQLSQSEKFSYEVDIIFPLEKILSIYFKAKTIL